MTDYIVFMDTSYQDDLKDAVRDKDAIIKCLLEASEFVHGLLIHGDETNEDDWREAGKRLAAAIDKARGEP